MTECEVTEIVPYREGYNKILSNLLSEDSFCSLDDYDGLVEDLEFYGQETGASDDIDVEWTANSIKKMIDTSITYYTLAEV